MLAGINDVLVITTPEDCESFKRLLGDGSNYGIKISYATQEKANGISQAFIIANEVGFISEKEPVCLILGDNIFHSAGLTEKLKIAAKNAKYGRASVFGYYVKDPRRYGVATVDKSRLPVKGFYQCTGIEEKPEVPKSHYAVIGLYFYPGSVLKKVRSLKPSARGELEITDLNNEYIKDNRLGIHLLSRGFTWFDAGVFDSLIDAGNYVQAVESRTGCQIACLEEIGYNNGWLSKEKLIERANEMKNNEYGEYLQKISEQEPIPPEYDEDE
jgi:glucose-1-phosphate thymidylyltransferase